MKGLSLLLLLCLALFACNKEKKKPYSYWTINGEDFKTNETQIYYGNAAIEFSSSNLKPGFFIYFMNNRSFPDLDSILIDSSGSPYTVRCSIIYNDTAYSSYYGIPAYLHQSKVNGHTQFELKGNWLYHSYRPDEDSVWATGMFVVP